MPYRNSPLVVDQIYHIYNRSVARKPIYLDKRDYERALSLIHYYSFNEPPLRYSHFRRLPEDQQTFHLKYMKKQPRRVAIYAFCLMPNHFHFLLSTTLVKGITRFISDFQNSYAKYFNTRNDRSGALFQSMFRARHIETDEQFLHVARYIHLNPYTSYVVKKLTDLKDYLWNSFYDYIRGQERDIVHKDRLMGMFRS